MSDAMERVLQLVAEGKLSAEDAAPILDALGVREGSSSREGSSTRGPRVAGGVSADDGSGAPQVIATAPSGSEAGGAKWARIMVMEGGRRVVDLRIPTSLGHFALGKVPGLSADQVSELRQAISTGRTGPLLEVEDPDGDGVKIVLE
ncbi:MAG TPA: hypothetical protein VJ506_06885 [Candidatus Limnocylindrales bacterium]|nr:hypothetical protein [Candidatus Limnocylindrales bacterium]